MTKTKQKTDVCTKYKIYLQVIFIIGNGVMLQSQFYEICKKLNISSSNYQTRKILNELNNLEIIKKQNFLYSRNKLIVLRKFGIRFLLNKEYSNQVSSLPKNIDKRAIYSIFKSHRIIQIIDAYNLYSWNQFLDKMYDLNSSLLYNKYKGIFYHEMLIKKYSLNISHQDLYLKSCKNYNIMLGNLGKGRNTRKNNIEEYSKLNIKTNKNINLENLTMDTLINANIHIQSIIDLTTVKIIDILIMDINNTQDINKIIKNIISTCIVLCSIFKNSKLKFRFKLLVWDEIARCNIKSKLGKRELFKDMNYVRDKLSSYRVEGRNILLDLGLDIDDIKISIIHLDFYNNYLENKKLYLAHT